MNVSDLPTSLASRIEVVDSGCWEWTRGGNARGYGMVRFIPGAKNPQYVHRLAYELLVAPIPDGLQIDHLCRNARCCNPEHLEPVTAVENMARRPDVHKSHCLRGHEMTPENTHIQVTQRGTCRSCQVCRKEWVRRRALARAS